MSDYKPKDTHFALHQAPARVGVFELVCIYERPDDFPSAPYVARRWLVGRDGVMPCADPYVFQGLEEARAWARRFSNGGPCQPRDPERDPKSLVESYVCVGVTA